MIKIRLDDNLPVPSTRRIQATGQLIAECAIARTGVLHYYAKELGGLFADRAPESVVRVAQLSEDLFSEETLEKFRSVPITIGHPKQDVSTTNMKELGKGTLEGKPYQSEDHLEASVVISDEDAIKIINNGVSELSVRATYNLVRVDDSMTYDAVRTIKEVNHVAIVEKGRAGITCRISDGEDGLVEVIDSGAVLILDDCEPVAPKESEVVLPKEIEPTLEELLDKAQAELDWVKAEVETLKAEKDDLTVKLSDALSHTPSDEDIQILVEARLKFQTEVASLSDEDFTGKTEQEIKLAIVSKRTGLVLNDASPTYIDARFHILLEDRETDTPMSMVLRQTSVQKVSLADAQTITKSVAELARERMVERNSHS